MDSVHNKQHRFSTTDGIAYALPVIPVLMLLNTNNVLSGIYAAHHGLTLSAISMVMLVAGLFDAVTDPSIGYLSDRYHARTGSRRPFVVAGALLLIPCAWFLLNPGEGVSAMYFLVWYLLFYLAMTLFQIPHLTWGGEISPVSEEKSRIYAYRNYALYVGSIIFALIPLLPFNEGTKITPETMRYLVMVAAVLLVPTLYMMLRHAPIGMRRPEQTKTTENPFRALMALRHNQSALWYIAAMVSHILTGAFYIALMFMVLDFYLGLGQYYVYLLLIHLGAGTLAVKPALLTIMHLGKIKALMLAYALLTPALLFLLLGLLNNTYSLVFFVLFNILGGMTSALANVAAYSLLSDIADYGTLKSGVDRSATYFSLSMLSGKTFLALGIAVSLAIAGWFGFDPTGEAQGPQVFWGLALCMCIIPLLLNVISIYCVSKITITEQRHAVIRKRLDLRAKRVLKAVAGSSTTRTHNKSRPSLCKI